MVHRASMTPMVVVEPNDHSFDDYLYDRRSEVTPDGWVGDGEETDFSTTLSVVPLAKMSVRLVAVDADDREMSLVDNGSGVLRGNIGTGANTVDYASGEIEASFDRPVKDGSDVVLTYEQEMIDPSVRDGVPSKYWKIVDDRLTEMTQGEKDDVDGVLVDPEKVAVYSRIDARTVELIGEGFTYDGETFSLSAAAQSNWLRIMTWKLAGTLTFPLTVSTKDNNTYIIADAAAFDAFYSAVNAAVTGHVGSGQAQKAIVMAMTTLAEVQAYVDPR